MPRIVVVLTLTLFGQPMPQLCQEPVEPRADQPFATVPGHVHNKSANVTPAVETAQVTEVVVPTVTLTALGQAGVSTAVAR